MADLDKLKSRLQGLRSKTTANGCTEEEALAAAGKVAELLDRHDLSLADLDLQEAPCEQTTIETGRKRRQPISACVPAIAAYCDCKVWSETNVDGHIRYVFFGMRQSVVMAHYVFDVIAVAMRTAWGAYDNGHRVVRYARDEKGSFLVGMAMSIADKLVVMKRHRDESNRAVGNGRDLVVVRHAVVEEAFGKLDLTLRRGRASGKKVSAQAFAAGQSAGRTLTILAAVDDGEPPN